MNQINQDEITKQICGRARNFGISAIAFVPVSRWCDAADIPKHLCPGAIWSGTETVIVIGMRRREECTVNECTINEILDETAYQLAKLLNENGCPSVYIPRDSDGSLAKKNAIILVYNHEIAGNLAGMGELITTSVLTTYRFTFQEITQYRQLLKDQPLTAENIKIVAKTPLCGLAKWESERESDTYFSYPLGKTVIILGVPFLLPIIETAPSIWGLEHDKTVKMVLDKAAIRLANYLNDIGEFAEITSWEERQVTEWGVRSGLGFIGRNGHLITPEFGMRIKLTAIVTSFSADVDFANNNFDNTNFSNVYFAHVDSTDTDFTNVNLSDFSKRSNLCNECFNCLLICPSGARVVNDCQCCAYNVKLAADYKNPCYACMKVCPIGEDRNIYRNHDIQKYFDEAKMLEQNPQSTPYRGWEHIRSYGSNPHKSLNRGKDSSCETIKRED
ncbi:MAG: hypothetical protein LBG58_15900 [Planctomycetaceae bacterium]|jgi:ferredoxin|nr:hypothetical protein [Planctomycetaceae bacterium]